MKGDRASVASAQEIKRNSGQIVDSIVSDDINKLPDTNTAEALERISGIQVGINTGKLAETAAWPFADSPKWTRSRRSETRRYFALAVRGAFRRQKFPAILLPTISEHYI